MKQRSFFLGDRSYEGQFERILGAGDVTIRNSEAKKVYCAGDLNIEHSRLEKVRCAGDIHAVSSHLGNIKMAGDIHLEGVCTADLLSAIGHVKAQLLQSKYLVCSRPGKRVQVSNLKPVAEWQGQFEAETFESLYNFRLSCDVIFKNIISSALLINEDEITCDHFYSLGQLQANTVNAESIFILSGSQTSADALTGSHIIVSNRFEPDKKIRMLAKTQTYISRSSDGKLAKIRSIEGDTIRLDHTKADLVSGSDIVIGDLCVIDKVEYMDQIQISDKAVVNEVKKI